MCRSITRKNVRSQEDAMLKLARRRIVRRAAPVSPRRAWVNGLALKGMFAMLALSASAAFVADFHRFL
jgi:hypothetical protein